MLFDVNVVSPIAFPDWVAKTAQSESVLNEESYRKLMQQSVPKERTTYRLEDPRLFDMIATQQIPPGPGPRITSNAGVEKSGTGHAR
jgi:cytochrome o ubiquinol oxidase subunit 2